MTNRIIAHLDELTTTTRHEPTDPDCADCITRYVLIEQVGAEPTPVLYIANGHQPPENGSIARIALGAITDRAAEHPHCPDCNGGHFLVVEIDDVPEWWIARGHAPTCPSQS